MKSVNPKVSFDLCHHNPYWAKRYFAADWKNWDVDRVFIQNYIEATLCLGKLNLLAIASLFSDNSTLSDNGYQLVVCLLKFLTVERA